MLSADAFNKNPHELHIKAGDIVYKQDSISNGVYIILEGEIEVSHEENGDTHHLACLKAGTLLGEVGTIEKTLRSVTATAITDTRLLFIEAAAFRRIFSHTNPLVRYVIESLASRLRSSYVHEEHDITHKKNPYGELFIHKELFMIGANSSTVAALIPRPLEIHSIPFRVSNCFNKEKVAVIKGSELLLPFSGHIELSTPHFEIVQRDHELWVRDLGSPHGTIVNHKVINKYSSLGVAHLIPGLNYITAGASDSRIRFIIQVPTQRQ